MDNFAKSVDLKSGEVGFLDDSTNESTDNTRNNIFICKCKHTLSFSIQM